MQRRIFYSWQSDIKGDANRHFIQQCLDAAAKKIAADNTVAVEPRIDRDTLDLPGSPEITTAIFHKINHTHVFVADISIINSGSESRKTPNPNVLIELGFALRSLGHERIILVFNTAVGTLDDLPFDLRSRRIMTYESAEDATSRADARKDLERKLDGAIRDALSFVPDDDNSSSAIEKMIAAIENQSGNRVVLLRKELKDILSRLTALGPPTVYKGGDIIMLKEAIDKSEPIILDFTSIAQIAVLMNDSMVIDEIYKWFGSVIEKYRVPDNGGPTFDGDYDFFRFVGHELMVTFIAFLLSEERYPLLESLLRKSITLKYNREDNGPGDVNYYYATEWAHLLEDESAKLNIASVHARILKKRHEEGMLAELMPLRDFIAADFFLYLYNKICLPDTSMFSYGWKPWSIVFMKEAPVFLKKIERKGAALKLAEFFNLASIDDLKTQIEEKTLMSRSFFNRTTLDLFLRSYDFSKIGTLL
ncbi:hypothetical protein BH09BAC6_BH09BAC6_17590 [soil metagenome]